MMSFSFFPLVAALAVIERFGVATTTGTNPIRLDGFVIITVVHPSTSIRATSPLFWFSLVSTSQTRISHLICSASICEWYSCTFSIKYLSAVVSCSVPIKNAVISSMQMHNACIISYLFIYSTSLSRFCTQIISPLSIIFVLVFH